MAAHCVRLGGVEVGADDAVFLNLAEDRLGVKVGERGRHCVGVECVSWSWSIFNETCLAERMFRQEGRKTNKFMTGEVATSAAQMAFCWNATSM